MKLYFTLLIFIICSSHAVSSPLFKVSVAVDGDNEALSNRLVSIITEHSRSLREHYLSDEELEAYKIKNKEIQRSIILLSLGENRLQADRERLNEHKRGRTTDSYRKEQKKLMKQLAKITVADPIRLWPVSWDKVSYPTLSEMLFLSERETTLWLHGSITELRSGLIYLDFYSTSSLTGVKEQLYNKAIISNDLELAATEIMTGVARNVLGREWASLTLEGNTKNSTILLNNKKINSALELQYIPVGDYSIEITKNGYEPFTRNYHLDHTNIIVISYSPNLISNEKPYYITTEPPGAQVSIDGDYMGTTPLSIEAGEGQIITLYRETYQSISYLLGSDYSLFFPLLPTNFTPKSSHEQQWFHATYSIFIVSLALPIIFFTLRSNALNLAIANSNSPAEFDRWRKKAAAYGYVGAATSGLSAVFLGVSLSKLYYYIKLKDQSPPQNKNKK